MHRGYFGLVALAGCIACSPPTQLLIVVDTDLEPGVEVGSIEVAVAGPGAPDRRVFPLESTALPFSLGVRPARRDDEAVHVRVSAYALDGARVVTFDADTSFVPGEVRVLDVPLARACIIMEPPCDDQGMTCSLGECVPSETDAASLPVRRGDEPQPLFEGPRVAPDAGPADAGATCAPGAQCDSGDPCRTGAQACDPPRCETVATLAPGTECGDGRVCDVEGRCGLQP